MFASRTRPRGDDDHNHRIIEALTDTDGYFAVDNVQPSRRYWVKEIEGASFKVPIPLRYAWSIGSKDSRSTDQMSVQDAGHFALTVNAQGKIGIKLTNPEHVATSNPEEKRMSIQFSGSSTLDRHRWFERVHAYSGWAGAVRADRRRIENERAEKKDKESKAGKKDSSKAKRSHKAAPKPSAKPRLKRVPLSK